MKYGLSRFPSVFLDRVKKIVPPGLVPQIHQGFLEFKPATFRINTLKAAQWQADASLVRHELKKKEIICEEVKNFPNAFLVKKGSLKKLRESKPYEEGWIYLQSLSSQIPPMALDPQPGERVLDLAAAPGGKTCQMAVMMQNQGEIVAVDPHPIRYEKLVYNLKKQGVEMAQAVKISGEKIVGATLRGCPQEGGHIGPPLHKGFDRILLDAPCSSAGTLCLKDPGGFNHWSLALVFEMAAKQKKLMRAAVTCLKPGGFLLYSTCALSPEENEAVIDWTLNEFPEMQSCPIPLKYPFLNPHLPQWQTTKFHRDVSRARRIYPTPIMEGFFVSLLHRPLK